MKLPIYFLIGFLLFLPGQSFATDQCSSNGYTITTINGVLTDKQSAIDNMVALSKKVGFTWNGQSIKYQYLLNPSHIGGVGDFIKAIYQKYFDSETVQDYDLIEMWKTASTEINTQKVLLVAHSQGNFYANSLYDVLADKEGGIPVQSIGVYSVATPASRVAGNGQWLTSETDHVIAGLVDFASRSIMPPNIRIEEVSGGLDPFSGHDFTDVYLKYKSERIISDIKNSLYRLKENNIQDPQKPCITPPNISVFHQATGVALISLDFVTNKIWYVVSSPVVLAQNTGTYLATTSINIVKNIGNSFASLFNNTSLDSSLLTASILPIASPQPASQSQQPNATIQSASILAQPVLSESNQVTPTSPATKEIPLQEIASTTIDIAVSPIILADSTPPIQATSTPDVVVPSGGGGWISGISPDPIPQVSVLDSIPLLATTTQDTATSTSEIATSTQENIVSITDIISTTTTPVIENTDSNPIVINEIAWMGTKAQANDEWIELYNRSDVEVDLTGWTLENKNKSLSVNLEKTIPAHGYFLLERTASTTTDRQEDMLYTGALPNNGSNANLYLKNGTTTIDMVDFGYWPFGDNNTKYTMERISAYATSTLSYNWKTYLGTTTPPFAQDAKGNDIFGTPGKKNSVSGFYTPAENITQDTTWYLKYSPYYIPGTITITKGATLTIEPGVTIKLAKGTPYGGKIDVYGILQSQGTLDKPILFTSFFDDSSDGIDSNQDGSATIPAPADWMNINLYNTQESSKIGYTYIRYGGQGINSNPNGWYPKHTGVVAMYGASPEILDTTFSFNNAIALYVKDGAHPLFSRNVISETAISKYQGVNPGGFGIYIVDGSSTADIINNTFVKNTTAILSESASDVPLIVKDNIFIDNTRNGEFNGYANFNLENSGNSDTGNKGGFFVFLYVQDGQQKTIHADSMPYIVKGGITVDVEGVLIIEKGSVLKSAPNPQAPAVPIIIYGTLKAQGTLEYPIVFTSFTDDSDGYDSDYSDIKPAPGDWQNIQFKGATSSDSVIDYATISYGGKKKNTCPSSSVPCIEYPGAVIIENSSPTISNSKFISNQLPDYTLIGNSNPVFIDNISL